MKVRRIKDTFLNIVRNLLVVVISFLCVLAFSELIIFRLILPATDIPRNQFVNGIIKYIPNQRGIFRKNGDIKTIYNINADGWNSRHDKYNQVKGGKYRIAIIGDSYVEALMVDYRASLAEQLEDRLGNDKFEVYRFGISGAALSEYFQILREEAVKYSPDLAVIVLVHNDFDESYEFVPGRYTSSFLKINIKNGRVIGEIPPTEYHETLKEYLLRSSAIFRYFIYNKGINVDNIKRLIFRDTNKEEVYQANIDISNLENKEKNNEIVTEYLMKEIKKVATQHNMDILIIMDGDRYGIYDGKDPEFSYINGVLSLNRMAQKVAAKCHIPFIDLHPIFWEDYQRKKKKFNSVSDAHWNTYGHEIAADTIYRYLQNRK